MDQDALGQIKALEAAGDYENPKYMELLIEHYYVDHILRMPPNEWSESLNRGFGHLNPNVYVLMQGPSELGARGKLAEWDRTADLGKVEVPTLIIGARYDTMDPEHMKWMAGQVAKGRYLECPNDSHLAIYDDQRTYFDGLTAFIHDVDAGRF